MTQKKTEAIRLRATPERLAELRALADRNYRPVSRELNLAIDAHLRANGVTPSTAAKQPKPAKRARA